MEFLENLQMIKHCIDKSISMLHVVMLNFMDYLKLKARNILENAKIMTSN